MAIHGYQFELSKWGDGSTRLVYWDSIHGKDIIFRLNENGTVERCVGHKKDTNDTEILKPVSDFVSELRRIAETDRL